ncbi:MULTISPECIES: hypothetical protein [Bradyrhizobium]|uniref:hypothetical protein n=1 Tax=Bradyrhizobium TaxID=374 RepID=UPI0004ACEF97|nr:MULTISPECIES: hypothetical protein [Bradyrhizobium]MBR1031910.1 hypothetical protein [Bradyrhizobium liaoningense]MDI2077661.1 hypothetical protein [Bradyrhizobium sp. Mp27]
MTDSVARDAAGQPLLTRGLDRRAHQGADFPVRTIQTIGDLHTLLADYDRRCERELSDISLTSTWSLIGGLVLATADNNGQRREIARNNFFTGLVARIKSVRASHIECDQWLARARKREIAAARRAVNWTRENKRLKERVAELEAELERRSVTWPRVVGE